MDRTSPIGLYNFGVSYLDAARGAISSTQDRMFDDPIEFLFAHGLELIFKADATRTANLDAVRKKFGHDLVRLRRNLSTEFVAKFEIDDQIDNIVCYLAIGHSGPNWRNRYIETGFRKAIPVQQILLALRQFNTEDRRWLIRHFDKVTP